jgi:hypothetical protein
MSKRGLAVASLLLLAPCNADAGAWTQGRHQWFTITSFDVARASRGYGATSRADAPVKFQKFYVKDLVEFGLTDRITLFGVSDYVMANATWANETPVRARDASFEGGVRYRITDRIGVLSLQSSYKEAGPFDLSNSIGLDAARIVEARLLYGTNFKLFGRDGFADIEAAQRWVTHPRPDEAVLDLTAGVWLGSKTMVMLQNFNVISGGDAEFPYTYFRTHKIELSVVRRLWGRWSVQLGGFVSPFGQNSLVEQGASLALWTRF